MDPLSIEQVLAEEAAAISPAAQQQQKDYLNDQAIAQEAQQRLHKKDADARPEHGETVGEVDRRKAFYRGLNKLNRSALSLSGGGIRSATFCLGVIQALAAYDVRPGVPPPEGEDGPLVAPPPAPEHSLLGRFNFLSTVSGGGYIGSWLSAWRGRDDYPTVWSNLTTRPDGPDVEPAQLSWLRAYSNYLTPKVGLGSADTWTGVALYIRNLVLNWLVIIPAVCLVLLALKLVAAAFVGVARFESASMPIAMGLIGALCLVMSQAFTTSHRPSRREPPGSDPSPHNVRQGAYLRRGLIWSVLSSMLVAIALVSRPGTNWIETNNNAGIIVLLALGSAAVFALGWLIGRPVRSSLKDFLFWALSGAMYGVLVAIGAILYTLLKPYSGDGQDEYHFRLLLPMMFCVPWVLTAQLSAEMVFVGLASRGNESDSDREWLGRSAGWITAAAVGWGVTAALSIALGHYALQHFGDVGKYLTSVGGATGIATALLGKSSKTSAASDGDKSWTDLAVGWALVLAAPLFVAILIILLSVALDLALLRQSFVIALDLQSSGLPPSVLPTVGWLLVGVIVAIPIGGLASAFVNINRFSMHAIYRNRLVRCYLGASRSRRAPDKFTGFDEGDNVPAFDLWPPKGVGGRNTFGLFHVVNIALNVVDSKRLAWQERKAESFTVTPLHCGSAYKGFRPSNEYAGPPGLTLGTAMAISGAAVSPNMGYHSSPTITLLLALFNVRLGWWLGNTGKEGAKTYMKDGPRIAIKPLIDEAFGLTTDERPYVYLSDGGHFENLGLYEMIRRRCRFIVVVDAGCDPAFSFEDLGNAVRKIHIDLGIRIRFDGLQTLRNRPKAEPTEQERRDIPYCTIGVIDYEAADGAEEGCANGLVLYIKPAYHGIEGAGIVSYATAHPTFPHETTTDQWFTESQFESYRSLGLEITNDVLRCNPSVQDGLKLRELLQRLPATTRAAPAAN